MPTMTLWLPLVWLVAAATATVTPVPTAEASSRFLQLHKQHLMLLVSPHPAPGSLGDVGSPVLPAPTTHAHPEELRSLDAPLKAAEPPSPNTPEGAPKEPGTLTNRSTAAPTRSTTQGPPSTPGTSAPPCPGDEEPAEVCGVPTGEQQAAVAEALGTFALRFYQHMAEAAQPDANLLFSPINIAMGLSHLLLGTRGETRERLGAILAYPPELACVHGALQQLADAPGLFSAVQIFHDPELRLQPRFLNESWHFYRVRPRTLSGNESLDLLHINEWVRKASRGLLPSILPTLPPQPRLLLLSAVHLQAPVPCPHSCLAHAAGGQTDGAAALPAPWAPPPPGAHHDQQEVPGGLLHRPPPAGPGGAAGAERGPEPGGAGATGAPGGAGDPGAGAGRPHLPGAAAAGGPHPTSGHCPSPAPPAPQPRPGRGGHGPRHGLRAVPGRGAVRAGTGPSGGGGRSEAPGGAGAGRGRRGGGGRHGHLGGAHGPAAGCPAPLPLRPLARCWRRPSLHGPPQRPPALIPARTPAPACLPAAPHCPPASSSPSFPPALLPSFPGLSHPPASHPSFPWPSIPLSFPSLLPLSLPPSSPPSLLTHPSNHPPAPILPPLFPPSILPRPSLLPFLPPLPSLPPVLPLSLPPSPPPPHLPTPSSPTCPPFPPPSPHLSLPTPPHGAGWGP